EKTRPPRCRLFSNSVVATPARARVRAARMPETPPPMTATFMLPLLRHEGRELVARDFLLGAGGHVAHRHRPLADLRLAGDDGPRDALVRRVLELVAELLRLQKDLGRDAVLAQQPGEAEVFRHEPCPVLHRDEDDGRRLAVEVDVP